MPTKTTDTWIQDAKVVHGDRYDYSTVNYKHSHQEVSIVCRIHGEFLQTPTAHLKGSGCSKCSGSYRRTTEDWVRDARKVHGDKYDYSKSIFKSALGKITITCKDHGDFQQEASSHLKGYGCKTCGGRPDISQVDYIERCLSKHGDKYGLDKTVYKGRKTKVVVTCKVHGHFETSPISFLKSNESCQICLGRNLGTSRWIEEAKKVHGDRYDYTKVLVLKRKSKVIITCKEHGDFEQAAYSHLRGYNCAKCSGKHQRSTEEWVEKARSVNGNAFDYSGTIFVDTKTPVTVNCKVHGSFSVNPSEHLRGTGCSKCHCSFGERRIERILDELGIRYIREYIIPGSKVMYRYDFYLPKYNIFIEFHGKHHFFFTDYFHGTRQEFERKVLIDDYKVELVKHHGNKLIVADYRQLNGKNLEYFILNRLEIMTNETLDKGVVRNLMT